MLFRSALLDLCGTVVLHWCGVDLQKEKRKQKRMSILSVVLPAYNEEQMVGKTCRVLHEVLSGAGISYELVLVNDGSKDNTWNEILKAGEKDPNILGVHFSRNFGKEAAVFAGLAQASGDVVAVMDCDLQDRKSTRLNSSH